MAGDDTARARGPFEIGAEIEGRYGVLRELGSGSVGVVYEAEHLFTGGRVAIKALYNRAGDHHQRMRLEARALAEMRHPNVVPVTDGGVTPDGVVWFAMPLLEGKTLREEIWRKRSLGVERALRIGIQIANGLAEAHARGLIHRDLKPENVFLVSEDDSVRVLDFGTSKFQRGELKTTDRFRIIGTHAYMSPERLQADLVDHRADIYALGHILYEMLSGMHALSDGPGPLDLPPTYELGLRQIYAPPPPLSERAPQTPGYVSHIVYRALAKDRKHRHESMSVLGEELDKALSRWLAESEAEAGERNAGVRAGPTPLLPTEKLSPDEQALLRDVTEPSAFLQPSDALSTGAEMRALESDLVLGAAQFVCPAGQDSEVLSSLEAICGDARAEPERVARLHAALLVGAVADEGVRRKLRLLLATPPDAEALDTALLALAQREPAPPTSEQRLVLLAQGAAVCIEPEVRLDAAESALFALDRAGDDVRPFALGVLIAFSRATPHQQAAARGALLALLLGGPEDTELARAELARLMMDVADRVPAEPLPSTTLPETGAPASASLGWSNAEPSAEPTSATPNTMATPSTPPLAPARPRPNLLVVGGIAALCSGAIAIVALLTRPASSPAQDAAEPRPSATPAAPALVAPRPTAGTSTADAASASRAPAAHPLPSAAPAARSASPASTPAATPAAAATAAAVGKATAQPPGVPDIDDRPTGKGETLPPAVPINGDDRPADKPALPGSGL